MYPEDFYYSKDHEWVRVEGTLCEIGITHYAQDELGEVVYVDLPEDGDEVAANDEIGSIESVKAVAEVYTPVSGSISEANSELADAPELVNQDPHGKGWLVRIEMSSGEELKGLMTAEQYKEFLESGS